jgi:hypothetical protein
MIDGRNRLTRERVAPTEDRRMRKVVSQLDNAQREALLEWADFGTAIFSAGFVVEVLRGLMSLVT